MNIQDISNIHVNNVDAKKAYLGNTLIYPQTSKDYIIKINIAVANQLKFGLNISLIEGQTIKVDWGDGAIETFNGELMNPHHTYTQYGEYIVRVEGQFDRFIYGSISYAARNAFIEVLSWGSHKVSSIAYGFANCGNLVRIADDYRNIFHDIDSAAGAFELCYQLEHIGPLFKDCPNLTNVSNICNRCSGLITFDSSNFKNSKNLINFYKAFEYCTNLETRTPIGDDKVELWERQNRSDLGYNSFGGIYNHDRTYNSCQKVSNWISIPNDWKGL